MKKSEPKMILNVCVTDDEFENKIQQAIDEYAKAMVNKGFDDFVKRAIDNRLRKFADKYNHWLSIDGRDMNLETYVKMKSDEIIQECIDENFNKILKMKIAKFLAEN